MELLRQAIDGGYRNLAIIRNDSDLDPLRSSADSQMLLQDLAFPAEPFGPDSGNRDRTRQDAPFTE